MTNEEIIKKVLITEKGSILSLHAFPPMPFL